MRFALFDNVRCDCGNEELSLEGAVVSRTVPSGANDATCRRYCGWKQRPIAIAGVTPEECRDCRSTTILEGTLTCPCGRFWSIADGIPSFAAKRLTSNAAGVRVMETNPRTDPRWEPFVRRHPRGCAFHHPGWLRALEEEYGQSRLHLAAEDEDGRLLAVLPMFYTRGLPFNVGGHITRRRLSSLPRTPSGGVLSVDPEATKSLLHAAIEYSLASGAQLELKTEEPGLEGLADGLVATRWRPTYVTMLPKREEGITFGNSAARHRLKWAVNKATKLGLELREADNPSDLRAWYPLYLEVMRQNAVPARPYRFFRAIWETLRREGVLKLLLAERCSAHQRTLLAGSIILTFGSGACYAFTGGKKKDFVFHPNDLIQWHAIHDSGRMGVGRYDFGEVAEEHQQLVQFKSKWCAEPIPQFRYYHPAPVETAPTEGNSLQRIRRLTSFAWRQVPLPATAACGEWLYRYL